MPTKGLITGLLLVLGATTMVVAPWAAPDHKRPRIVSAAMLDVDRDARADSVRLTYSVRVRHLADRDGRYPFAVAGYRVRSVGAASRKALVLLLAEKPRPDPGRRTRRLACRFRLAVGAEGDGGFGGSGGHAGATGIAQPIYDAGP